MLVRFCATLIAAVVLAPSLASAGVFKNAPDAIVCSFAETPKRPAGTSIFYIDTRFENGTLVYKGLGGSPLILKVGANGVVEAGRISGCSGKSLRQLRSAGRAFDFR